MCIFNYFISIIIFNCMVNCSFVNSNEQNKKSFENLYLVKGVPSNKIHESLIKIINNDKMENNNNKEQEITHTGAIVILSEVDKYAYEKNSAKLDYIMDTKKKVNHKPILRTDNREIVFAVVNNRKKSYDVEKEGLSIEDFRDSIPRAKMIDSLNNNILRDKYGDACIKVAVRKCYKALYIVNKNVCRTQYKCKSKFRSYFKKKSKEGCIQEFDYSKGKREGEVRHAKYRDNKFVDATREGYLDACIPYMVPNYKVLRNAVNLRNVSIFGNVLRKNKSERKCQRLSKAKCYRACGFALNETCAKYDCSRRRRKRFIRVCKEECSRVYIIKKTTDSESD